MLLLQIAAWYALSGAYNVYNGKLKRFPYPFVISILELAVGAIFVLPLYILGIRKAPKLSLPSLLHILPIVLLNSIGHVCSIVATFETGGGALTQIIKSSEPVVSVVLSALFFSSIPSMLSCLSLVLVTGGVAYASTSGNLTINALLVQFSSKTALLAMIANISFTLRSWMRKKLMTKDFINATDMNPVNEHAVTTVMSTIVLCGFLPFYEAPCDISLAFRRLSDKQNFSMDLFFCSVSFFVYNEIQNKVLGSLGPLSTAVGNTLKRVIILIALFVFVGDEVFTINKAVGSIIAVVGCFMYSVVEYYQR